MKQTTTATEKTGVQNGHRGPNSQSTSTPKFSFLYQRSSDEIGMGVAPPSPFLAAKTVAAVTHSLDRTLGKDTLQRHNSEEESTISDAVHSSVMHIHAEKYLQAYHHQTKAENPLYRTSQSVIGAHPPSVATVVTERYAIPQAFSSSVGNILFSDQSLNTTLTRSKVHRSLDPHFY
ncbi:hypothetical protein VYU27_001048 [Nannochloropsis oceanica]